MLSLVVFLFIFRKCKSVFIGVQVVKYSFDVTKIAFFFINAIKSMDFVVFILSKPSFALI